MICYLGVLTADCVPIIIYDARNKIIGCIHAGWKGAFSGIIDNTIKE
jgi:copper oxidase (laccase) domain-containing protein